MHFQFEYAVVSTKCDNNYLLDSIDFLNDIRKLSNRKTPTLAYIFNNFVTFRFDYGKCTTLNNKCCSPSFYLYNNNNMRIPRYTTG